VNIKIEVNEDEKEPLTPEYPDLREDLNMSLRRVEFLNE
jgi:hypothetical protein